MKICHITSVHRYDDPRIFLKECQSLAKTFEVHLIAPDAPKGMKSDVLIHSVPGQSKKLKRMITTVQNVYAKALEVDADIYHFHDPELIRVGLKLKKQGKKVIYDVHEDVSQQLLSKDWIPNLLKKPLAYFVEKYEKTAARSFDMIVTATPQIEERFQSFNANTLTVQNFPILEEWLVHVDKKTEAKVNGQNAVYVGSITKPRGIFEMVKAMEVVNETNGVHLLLGGKFGSAQLEQEVRAEEGWRYVEFLGWLNRKQVVQAYNKATIGLVLIHPEPRYKVSYPVKLFEYMAAGIPVIVSNFPLWKKIVNDSQCGLTVNPLNPNEIADAITWFIEHPDQGKEMGKNGKIAIQNHYNWPNEAGKLTNSYEQLLGAYKRG